MLEMSKYVEDISSKPNAKDQNAEIQVLEDLLKCPACYDYINTAMILPNCQHNYCSLCIRKYLCYKTQCPTCSASVTGPELRNNRLLDSVIEQYKKLRQPFKYLLKEKGSNRNDPTASTSEVYDKLQSPVITQLSSLTNNRNEKPLKKVLTVAIDSDVEILENNREKMTKFTDYESDTESQDEHSEEEVCKKTNGYSKTSASFNDIFPILNNNVNGELGTPSKQSYNFTKISPRIDSSTSQMSNDSQPSCSTPVNNGNNPKRVDCPVCGISVREEVVNRHLDNCLNKSEKKESLRSSRKKPLTKLVYNLMSDKDIRKKLQEIGLSTEGVRQDLIKRHQDFSLFHNSDCDSLNPKTTKELVKCYEKSEQLKQKLAATSTVKGLNIDKNADATQIRKAQKTYVKKHKNQFTDLIEQTKKRMTESKKHEKKVERNNLPVVNISCNENKPTIITESSINNVESLLPTPVSHLENGDQSTAIDPNLNSNFLQDIQTKGILTRQISTSSHGSFDLFPDNDIGSTYSDKKKYSDENRLKDGDNKHESGCKSLCRKSLFSHQASGKVTSLASPRKNSHRIDHYFSPSPEKMSFKMSPVKGYYVDDSESENGDISSVRNISQIIDNSLCTTDEHVSDLWPALTQKFESTNNTTENIDTLDNSDATSDIIPVKIMEPPSLDVIRRPTRSSLQKGKEVVVRRSGRRKRQDEDQEETRPTKRQKR